MKKYFLLSAAIMIALFSFAIINGVQSDPTPYMTNTGSQQIDDGMIVQRTFIKDAGINTNSGIITLNPATQLVTGNTSEVTTLLITMVDKLHRADSLKFPTFDAESSKQEMIICQDGIVPRADSLKFPLARSENYIFG